MRIFVLAAGAILLAGCTTPTTMPTGNLQQAAGPNKDEQPRAPAQLHRPALRINGGTTQGFGGMY